MEYLGYGLDGVKKGENNMSMMMFNGIPYGGGVQIIDKTYEEYQALSEAEKMRDDVIYDITDRESGVVFGNDDISGIGDGTVTGAISALNGNLLKYNSFEFNLEAGSGLTQNVIHRIDFDFEEILSVYVESIGVSNNYANRTQLTAWSQYSDLLYMDFYGDSDVYIVKIGVLYK